MGAVKAGSKVWRGAQGDASRPRRFADAARQRWYARHRAERFARRMLGGEPRGQAE